MLKPLTSLRFVFAYMVFAGHLGGLFVNYNQSFLRNSFAKYFSMSEGYLGVSFFFILSGFILSFNYKDRFLKKETTFKQFILARIFRIYPLHCLTFLYVFFLSSYGNFGNLQFWQKSFSNLFLIQSFVPIKAYFFSFNGVSWSISNELFFYILFPSLLLFFSKFKKISLSLLLIPLAIIVTRQSENINHWVYYINPLFRVFDFFLGIVLYHLYVKFKDNSILKKQATFLEIAVIMLFVGFYYCKDLVHQDYRWSLYYWIPMALIIFIFALQSGAISKFLSKQFCIWLGEISFAFYMIHQLVINLLQILNYKFRFFDNGYLLILTALFVSILGSGILYTYFEKPLNTYLRKKFIK